MTETGRNDVVVRMFRGNDTEQFESYVQFYDANGFVLATKHLSRQETEPEDEFSNDMHYMDLNSFYFYEWDQVGRIECHSDVKEICLASKIRPKIGTVEFLDERRKDMIKRGRYTFVDEGDVAAQYDISEFFDTMGWTRPEIRTRRVKMNLFDPIHFPVHVESTFVNGETYTASVRFFDQVGNLMDLGAYSKQLEHEDDLVFEEWTVIDLPSFLKDCWNQVSTVESRSDLSAIDRLKYVKGNIDYLIYCKANNYKKLPEYLYKRIQTKKLEAFLQDIRIGI
jgi:hypothetical protein